MAADVFDQLVALLNESKAKFRVIEHEARKLKRTEGLSGLLDELGRIRLAMVLRASGKKGGRPRAEWQLEEADADLLDLFRALVPDKRPFVYTPASP